MNDLDAAWNELLLDACASDGPIRDNDVRQAIQRNRPHIEAAALSGDRPDDLGAAWAEAEAAAGSVGVLSLRRHMRTGEYRAGFYDPTPTPTPYAPPEEVADTATAALRALAKRLREPAP